MYRTSTQSQQTHYAGPGVLSVCQIVFLILKIAKLVDWSWWIVFAPTFVAIALIILFILVLFLVNWIYYVFRKPYIPKQKKSRKNKNKENADINSDHGDDDGDTPVTQIYLNTSQKEKEELYSAKNIDENHCEKDDSQDNQDSQNNCNCEKDDIKLNC